MRRRTMALLSALALTAMILAGCASGSGQTGDGRTFTVALHDATTTAAVKLALAFERGVKATEINVGTDRGVVTLHGEVGSEAERQLAVKVAEDVHGVTKIVNRIDVRTTSMLQLPREGKEAPYQSSMQLSHFSRLSF